MGKLKGSIVELKANLASAKAKSDQADMEHRDLNLRLRELMFEAVDNDDGDSLGHLIGMYMQAENLKSENNRLIQVTETYLRLLEDLDEAEAERQ